MKLLEKGFALVFLCLLTIPLVGLAGLAIDTGLVYAAKTRLSGAVDAAALAGARALSRGSDDTAQRTRAQEVASAFVRANFPSNSMLTRNLVVNTPTIDVSVANQRSITVSASVESPAMFLRIVGGDYARIRSAATAIRRDVNIALVLDRSKSMNDSGSCDDLRAAATGFVTKFAAGRDYVGLVTYATSSYDEFAISNNFATANPNLETIVSRITCASGGTSTAAGLMRGYQMLATRNEPSSLNAIVFFTDGQPTAVETSVPIANASPCPAAARPTLPGVWTVGGSSVWGILRRDNGPSPVADDNRPTLNSTGCKFAQSWTSNVTDTSDYTYIPDTDVWGNRLDTGYMTGISRSTVSGAQRIRKDVGANVVPAATNAADDAALRIRNGAVINGRTLPNVVIFGIGLGVAAQPANHDFMLRVTNDPRSPIYSTTQREGLYIFAPTAADINDAFTRLASEVLRLAQ